MEVKKDVEVGPWGGPGGAHSFEFKPNGRITKIYIKAGSQGGCIDSIHFGYIPNGSCHECQSQRYGGGGGYSAPTMHLECGEKIVELSGTIGCYSNYKVITSLCFKTNKKTCSFGWVRGEKFSLPVKASTKFVGFHGRYGAYIDSIGAILVAK